MIILRKKKGLACVLELLPVMLTIVMCGIMILFFAGQAKYLDTCNEINNLARGTMLKMESQRGLTAEEQQRLQEELESLGVSGISFDGTTGHDSKLRPGDEITLCISCEYSVSKVEIRGMMNFELPGVERQIQVKRSSVVLK